MCVAPRPLPKYECGIRSPLYPIQTTSFASNVMNRIDGVMVSVLALSAVDRRLEPRSGQTKYYTIGICYFSAKHAALKSKSKNWVALNQNNVSDWSDISIPGLLFQ